jgi:hypothetical protein
MTVEQHGTPRARPTTRDIVISSGWRRGLGFPRLRVLAKKARLFTGSLISDYPMEQWSDLAVHESLADDANLVLWVVVFYFRSLARKTVWDTLLSETTGMILRRSSPFEKALMSVHSESERGCAV